MKKHRKSLTFISQIPHMVFLSLFILSSAVSIYTLRHNNLTMVKLRIAVYEADKNNGDVNRALNNLRKYVYGHMNTNLSSGGNAIKPPIQLKYTYERLRAAELGRVNASNSGLYTDAENYCQAKIPEGYYGAVRIPCVIEYVTSHSGTAPKAIPTALYQFDFISPAWSPDLAGWSLVFTTIFLVAFIAKLGSEKLLGAYFRKQEL